eukprot:3397450-Rhodomonas_salina.1
MDIWELKTILEEVFSGMVHMKRRVTWKSKEEESFKADKDEARSRDRANEPAHAGQAKANGETADGAKVVEKKGKNRLDKTQAVTLGGDGDEGFEVKEFVKRLCRMHFYELVRCSRPRPLPRAPA